MTDTKQPPIPRFGATAHDTGTTPPEITLGLKAACPASTDDCVGVEGFAGLPDHRQTSNLPHRGVACDKYDSVVVAAVLALGVSPDIDGKWINTRALSAEAKITAQQHEIELRVQQGKALNADLEIFRAKITALEAQLAAAEMFCLDSDHFRDAVKKRAEASSQMLQVKLDAATEDRDKWLAERNRLRDSWSENLKQENLSHGRTLLERDGLQAKVEQLTRERDAALVK